MLKEVAECVDSPDLVSALKCAHPPLLPRSDFLRAVADMVANHIGLVRLRRCLRMCVDLSQVTLNLQDAELSMFRGLSRIEIY